MGVLGSASNVNPFPLLGPKALKRESSSTTPGEGSMAHSGPSYRCFPAENGAHCGPLLLCCGPFLSEESQKRRSPVLFSAPTDPRLHRAGSSVILLFSSVRCCTILRELRQQTVAKRRKRRCDTKPRCGSRLRRKQFFGGPRSRAERLPQTSAAAGERAGLH